jgi:hypothetical protein
MSGRRPGSGGESGAALVARGWKADRGGIGTEAIGCVKEERDGDGRADADSNNGDEDDEQ